MAWDGQDHTDVIAEAKRQLLAFGVDLAGPCGAFKIINRAAWAMRASGAGLLSKTSGTNCGGYASDIIAYPDGTIVDGLIAGGEANTPAWQVQPGQVDPSRWRPPFDPSPLGPVPAPIVEPLPAYPVELAVIVKEIAEWAKLIMQQSDLNTAKIQHQIDQAIHNAEKSAAPIVALLEGLTK